MRRDDVAPVFKYKGYMMRSHSETRWASMMDFLGIRWQYEPRVFNTSLGGYLPDFYLPDMMAYAEVKGPAPTDDELTKGHDVQELTGLPVIFLHGKPALDGVHLINSFVMAYVGGKKISASMYELTCGIEKYKGGNYCMAFSATGRIQSPSEVVHVPEYIEEYLLSFMSRREEEQHKAGVNAKLNREVGILCGPMTFLQYMIFGCLRWVEGKINKDLQEIVSQKRGHHADLRDTSKGMKQ